ncbi:MAG: hypothetical protein OEY49_09625 [Candidatus Heimdallarchaeota archaeon]|nr:hypothetical protein [Candidatus Heimdallarchaeota archaeon]
MDVTTIIDLILSHRKSILEGMHGTSVIDFPWGIQFNWKANIYPLSNFSYIQNLPIEEIAELRTWIEGDKSRRFLVSDKQIMNKFTNLEVGDLDIYWRDTKSVKLPISGQFDIIKYSFNIQDRNFDVKILTDTVCKMLEVAIEDRIEFGRFIGGILHMVNGEFWVLHDGDLNIRSIALISNLSLNGDIKLIEFIVTHKQFRREGHAKMLLNTILGKNPKTKFIFPTYTNMIELEIQSFYGDFLINHAFKLISKVNLFRSQ